MTQRECSLHGNLWLIPPSRSGLKEHIIRAAYYAGWVNFQCVENVCLPFPSDWGWRFGNGMFTRGIQVELLLMQIPYQQLVVVHHKNVSDTNVLHFRAFHFASVNEIASTNLFRVYSLIFSDFVDFSGIFIVCKYCYSLLKS